MKHVKLFENFVNEAKVDARGFEDEFSSLIFDVEEDHGEEIGDDAIAALLTVVWDEVVEQNNFHEMIGSLGLVFRNARVAVDNDFRRGYAEEAAVDFGANMYDSTGFSWDGTMECFKPLFSYAGANASQVRKIEKQLNDFYMNESVVNERLSKSELNKIEDFIEGLDRPELFDVCDEFYIEDDQFQANKHDLDDDDLRMYAMEYIESEDIKFKDVKAMVS